MKKLDLYTFIYNDEDILPFFLDYYRFVNRITFIDSGSDDRSLDIINHWATPSMPQIRICQTGLKWWDHQILHEYRNQIWKDSDYDLVFFPDCDEFFYKPDLVKFLNTKPFNDVYEMEGFEMVAKKMPKIGESILTIKTGVPFHMYNKSTIFNPKCDIQFINAHVRYCSSGKVDLGSIYLLHYRNIGIQLMQKRRDREQKRLPKNCSYRKAWTNEEIKLRFDNLLHNAKKVI